MAFNVCGIPMALIPHPQGLWQGPWLEGITPITNPQWAKGVEPLLNEGAKYCLLEPRYYREDRMVRHFGDCKDLLDTVGHDNVPKDWDGKAIHLTKADLLIFQWRRTTSRKGFDGDGQPAVDLSWAEAKAWTLMQGGLYLLTRMQWAWSCRGGERNQEYVPLVGPGGEKLVHCSFGTREQATIDVNDSRYPDGPFGLRHKSGNVWEWVEKNPDISRGGYGLCGGSWNDRDPNLFRADACAIMGADSRNPTCGFRVGALAPISSTP